MFDHPVTQPIADSLLIEVMHPEHLIGEMLTRWGACQTPFVAFLPYEQKKPLEPNRCTEMMRTNLHGILPNKQGSNNATTENFHSRLLYCRNTNLSLLYLSLRPVS